MRYEDAPDVKRLVEEIVLKLELRHIPPGGILCLRSYGSKARWTTARIHSLSRAWQNALKLEPRYLIEVISERYDRLSEEGKEKTVIHELLHIPEGFKGGFRPHKGWVTSRRIDELYRRLKSSPGAQ
ncbi:MAG: putative metallopeptidase [Candidatus Bathyarchaeia archaeon]